MFERLRNLKQTPGSAVAGSQVPQHFPHRDICDRLIVRVKVTYIWYQMIPVKGKVNVIKYALP